MQAILIDRTTSANLDTKGVKTSRKPHTHKDTRGTNAKLDTKGTETRKNHKDTRGN